jgi:hypothetical protein
LLNDVGQCCCSRPAHLGHVPPAARNATAECFAAIAAPFSRTTRSTSPGHGHSGPAIGMFWALGARPRQRGRGFAIACGLLPSGLSNPGAGRQAIRGREAADGNRALGRETRLPRVAMGITF